MAKKIKSVTVDDIEPVEHEGKTYASLTFRRMRVGDASEAEDEENKMRASCIIYANMAGVPVEVIEKLDMDDFETVARKTLPLMGKSAAAAFGDLQAKPAKEQAGGN